MSDIDIEIKGLEQASAKMEQMVRDLQGPEFMGAMKRVVLIVLSDARKNAPVRTGRLQASIAPEIRTVAKSIVGVVGSPVEYAAKIEMPGPVRRSGRRPYLLPALTENEARIVAEIGEFVGKVVSK